MASDKRVARWYSTRLQREITLARWGHYGQPVLLFPTAGGDAEEAERMYLVDSVRPLIDAGRIKLYSCDSAAGLALAKKEGSVEFRCWLLKQFGEYVAHELVPAISTDCGDTPVEPIVAGASIGAFNAVSALCRYPHLFKAALAMSGTYDLERLFEIQGNADYYLAAPTQFLPNLDDPKPLARLQGRFALLAYGQGRWESADESWQMANLLGVKGVPNRVDPWGQEFDHDWPTWRQMLPHYLDELVA